MSRVVAALLVAAAFATSPVGVRAQTAASEARCAVPDELLSRPALPRFVQALSRRDVPVSVVVVSPLGTTEARATADAVRWPARLHDALRQAFPGVPIQVQIVGEPRATAARGATLIESQVLPMRPDLVLWSLGRADLRRGVPSARFGRALERGLKTLADAGIDTIVLDLRFHPQSEALFRSIDHRQQLRWIADEADAARLRRYEMIEHWDERGAIDLDSTAAATQAAAFEFVESCTTVQVVAMLRAAAAQR